MALFTKLGKEINRPVDASGDQRGASMADEARWKTEAERFITAATGAPSVVFDSKSTLDASLNYPANTFAWVIGDADPSNDGIYAKGGSSGAGSWTRLGGLPYSFISALNSGAGTADAILADTDIAPPSAAYGAMFLMNVTTANTGAVTISLNSGTAKPLKTNIGTSLDAGYLVAGMLVAFVDDGTNYRMISDPDSAANLAASEAAKDTAVAAAATASAAATTATNAASTATTAAAASANSVGAMIFDFDSGTSDADPGDGEFALNNADPALATEMYIDVLDNAGVDVSAWIETWDDSSNTGKGKLIIRSRASSAIFRIYNVTGSVVTASGYRKVTIAHLSGSGTLSGECAISFAPTGNQGAAGAGTGDMLEATYDPNGYGTDAFSMGNMQETSTAKILTATERTTIGEVRRDTPTPPTFAYRFKEGQPLPSALTFTRDGTAVRRNRAALLENTAAETLRHHYVADGTYLGVLIEDAATNLVTYSEDLADASWSKTRSSITSNATADPFGTSWDKFITDATAASSHFAAHDVTGASGLDYCLSAFFKAAEYDWARMLMPTAIFGENKLAYFDLTNGVVGSTTGSGVTSGIEDYGGGWFRCWMAATATASATSAIGLYIAEADGDITIDGDSSSGIYVGGVQFEAGRTAPSSYVATTSATVARAEDEPRAGLTDIGFNEDEGAFYWCGTIDDAAVDHGLLLAYETSSAGISLSYDSGNFRARKRDGGSSDLAGISYTPVKGEIIRVVGYWTAALVGISVNGSAAVEVAGTEAPSPTEFRIGDGHAGAASAHHNGTLLEWAVYDRAPSAAEAARMSSRGVEIGETLYLPDIMRKRYVAMSDFAPTSDAAECYPAWLEAKAVAEATGGQLVFDAPYGTTRHYRFLDKTLTGSQVVDVSNIVDIAFNGGIIDCSAFALSGARRTLLYSAGSLAGVQHSLASNAAVGDTSIVLSSGGSSYSPGDIIFVRADNAFTADYANQTQEKQIVKRVVSNTIHLVGALRAAYTTAQNAEIEKVTPGRTKRIVNPQVIGPGRWTGDNDGDYGIWLELLQGATVIGGKAQYADFNNFRVANCFDTEVINATSVHAYEGDGTNTKNQYAFNIQDGCEGVYYRDCHAHGGKHAMVQGVGGVAGVTRDCGWLGGSVQDTWHNAGAAHTNAERLRWEGIDISGCAGGIDPRCEFATVKNNAMRNLSRSTAISVGSLGIGVTLRERLTKWIVTNNEIDGCNYGMRLGTSETIETGPGFLNLNDNIIRNATQRGIEVYYDDTTDSKFGLSICRNTLYGIAGVGIYVYGDFRYPVISENIFTGGSAFACVLMTGDTGQGPRSPVIENNRYQNYAAPSVSQDTGTSSVARNFAMT